MEANRQFDSRKQMVVTIIEPEVDSQMKYYRKPLWQIIRMLESFKREGKKNKPGELSVSI